MIVHRNGRYLPQAVHDHERKYPSRANGSICILAGMPMVGWAALKPAQLRESGKLRVGSR
jgi:hypothetical protein